VGADAFGRQGGRLVNNIYFACRNCRVFVDAGYRHAYWTLEEPGIVARTTGVDVETVIATEPYWQADGAEWLIKLLPAVRQFVEAHREHEVWFGDAQEFGITPMFKGDYRLFEWLMDAGFVYEELPRYYVERLGLRRWDQVVEHISTSENRPWWWLDEEYTDAAREKFVALVTELDADTHKHDEEPKPPGP
jgi:hypothetical protein